MKLHKDYLKKFEEREDNIAIRISSIPEGSSEEVSKNEEAYEDLEINSIFSLLANNTPNFTGQTKEYIRNILHSPLNDSAKIKQRQDSIEDLLNDDGLREDVTNIKLAADDYLYNEKFEDNYNDSKVQFLETTQLLFNLYATMADSLSNAKSEKLIELNNFKKQLENDEGFQKTKKVMEKIYVPNNLGSILAKMRLDLSNNNLYDVKNRREFYNSMKILDETTQRLLNEEGLKGFLNNEVEGVKVLQTIKEKSKLYNLKLFSFKGDLENFQYNNNKNTRDMLSYWISLLTESINANMPKIDISNLPEELGFYLGAANVAREWKEKGISVTRPEILEKEERTTFIEESYNVSLLNNIENRELVPNDIKSNPSENLFTITGPNNGGKTTYIRQVGQNYWLAQLGMFLPAKNAKVSLVDGIYTSFTGGDDTDEGTGQYLTELNRVSEFTNPENGNMHTTPYSLLFFDEFGNGTDHEESVKRTKIVLNHLSQKGVTAYFTTHKHEIADMSANGELPGSLNLASAVKKNGKGIIPTHKIIRGAQEKSYGHIQAESMGITPEKLEESLKREIKNKLYPIKHTRL